MFQRQCPKIDFPKPSVSTEYYGYHIEQWDGVGSEGRDLFYVYRPTNNWMVFCSASVHKCWDWIEADASIKSYSDEGGWDSAEFETRSGGAP
jgi:hypothetical protein